MLLPLFLLLLSILSFFYPAIAKEFEECPMLVRSGALNRTKSLRLAVRRQQNNPDKREISSAMAERNRSPFYNGSAAKVHQRSPSIVDDVKQGRAGSGEARRGGGRGGGGVLRRDILRLEARRREAKVNHHRLPKTKPKTEKPNNLPSISMFSSRRGIQQSENRKKKPRHSTDLTPKSP